ncbi:MAG TPA: DNA primase [Chloroflexota bacterium]|nr:DNA primase [Chloroflexota bacterium]
MGDEREEIRSRLPIETLVGEHVSLKRAGRNLSGLCPFHKEKSPSFIVSPERGSFHCFGCGAGGDVFRFYMLINKVEFPDAIRALAARVGVELDPEAGRRKAAEARSFEVLQAVSLYFQQALASQAGAQARDYLSGRGLTRDTIERFALGFMPDWGEGIRRLLPERGVSEQELVDASVLLPSDQGREPFCPLHGRIIFPIRDQQGRVTGFGGRVLGDGKPKYLNSRQSAIFNKSAVLYTIDRAAEPIRAAGEAVIVEGYLDAVRAHQEGFTNVVASLGTAITVQQLGVLARLRTREAAPLKVVLALDADPAGARAAAEAGVRATIELRPAGGGTQSPLAAPSRSPLNLHIATLPEGRDPDEVIAEDPAAWRAAIGGAPPAMDYLFDLVQGALDPRLPTFAQDLLAQLLPIIGQLPGVGVQQPYLERLATITRIDTAALRGELSRLRGEKRRGERQVAAGEERMAALRRVTQARDTRTLIEEELLALLLRQSPLDPAALDAAAAISLGAHHRRALLTAILAAHAGARPTGAAISETLPEPDREQVEAWLAAPTPPAVEPAKLPRALQVYADRLERLAQSDRLKEQSALLDQVDGSTARELMAPTQELVTSRNDLTKRMIEAQSEYHLR